MDDISHIINYSLPDELEVYIHRSGRTGRWKEGLSLSLIATSELVSNLVRWKFRTTMQKEYPQEPKSFKDRYYTWLQKVDESHVPAVVFDNRFNSSREV